MLVAQISDLHAECDGLPAYGVADTDAMLAQAVDHLLCLKQAPDCVVVTGDLASSGKKGAYENVARELNRLPMPIYVLPGNHDKRDEVLHYLGQYCPADPTVAPYLCYAIETPLRLVMLDTTRPGSHAGHVEQPVLQWLKQILSNQDTQPTLLFLHHPPFWSGLGVMDEPFENVEALAAIVRQNPQVRLCSGHLHRSLTTMWQGRICIGAPSIAMQMEVDLCPQGGDAFVMEAPGYVLHHFTEDKNIISHFCQIPGVHSYSGPHPFAGSINPV